MDSRSGLNKGAATITFQDNEGAVQAVQNLDGGQLDGQVLKISLVLVRRKREGLRF